MTPSVVRARRNREWLGRAAPAALAMAALGWAPYVHAQAANTGKTQSATPAPAVSSNTTVLDEIVVTARKREERLRDIPTAGTALGADLIREIGGVATAQSLLTNTPGVNFANTSNPVTSEVSIRGSGTSRATTAESGVGLFRDGAYIGGGTVLGRTFTDIDLFDAERIEVLRGVQGGLNGRNAEGGAINVISARPTHNFEGYAFGDIANNDHYEGQLVVNLPIDDHWAARFGADLMDQDKGFYKMPLLNRYADQQYKHFYRGQLNFNDGPFTANLLVDSGQEELPGLVYQLNTFPSATYPTGVHQDRFSLPWNSPSEAKMRMTNYEFTTNTDFSLGSLVTTSMYRDRYGENAYDRDAESPQFVQSLIAAGKVATAAIPTVSAADTGLGGNQLDHAKIFYQDVHFTGDKVGNFTWLMGADYYRLQDLPQSILAKTPTAASPSTGTDDVGHETFTSYAAYASLGYDLTSKFNISGDMRETHDEDEFVTNRVDFGTGLPAANGVAFDINGVQKQDNFSYTVTGTYKIAPEWMVYAKVGSAFRPGGFNTSLGDARQPTPVPTSYQAETLTSYEVGTKGNLASNIYLTVSAYDNEFDNLIIQGQNGCFVGSPVCPVQQTVFAFNAGPASLWGVEFEADAKFDVFGGPLRLTLGGSRQGGKIGGTVYNGLRQPQQPDWTATMDAYYTHPITDTVTGFINLKGNGRWGGVQEVAQIPLLDDYTDFDARAGVQWGRYELAAHAENLFNTTYVVFGAPTALNNVLRYNFPRTYGVSLRYTW
ncbi:MAG TPA: TonB-dependent receptor [Phenylobacterium sp.]|jgi:iron complex outermembrane receptor protein|nr:TonB-dependent receptor [Phenylobacterium sp.]